MLEIQTEPTKIKIEDVSKKIVTVENKIKDDEFYQNQDTYKILAEVFEFRTTMSSNFKNIVDKLGRSDIVETFQSITIAAELQILNDLNDRLNEMLKLATYIAETTAIGAIAGYLELKERKKILDTETKKVEIKLNISKDVKEIIKIYKKYRKKDWKELEKLFGVEDQDFIKNILEKRGILDEGKKLLLEYNIYKSFKEGDLDKAKVLLYNYAKAYNIKSIKVFLDKGVEVGEVLKMFKGVFRILRVK